MKEFHGKFADSDKASKFAYRYGFCFCGGATIEEKIKYERGKTK